MTTPVTSEARVDFAALQQATSQDVLALGTLGQGSLDNVVENCLIAGSGYAGLSVAISGVSGLTVQPGFLIQGGPAYALRDIFTLDLAPQIVQVPDSTKTLVVLIVADGQESPTGQSRTFLDASKKPTDPADPWPTVTLATDTRIVRSAIVSKVAGTADVQPLTPPYNAALCLLATVVVSNTGIVSVTQATAQQITRLDQLAPVVAGLSAVQATLQGATGGLLSSVSALALGFKDLRLQIQALAADFQAQINALAARTTAPAAALLRGADFFIDKSQSNPAASGYNAVISGGLRFATSSFADVPFTPQNPYAGNLKVSGNYVMPAYTEATLLGRYPYNSGLAVLSFNQFGAVATPVYRRGFSRARIQSSVNLKAIQAQQLLANGDPSQIFAIDPTTFVYDPTWGAWQTSGTEFIRNVGYAFSLASRGFWTPVVGVGSTGGVAALDQPHKAQTTAMVTSVDAYLYGGTGQPVRLLVTGDSNGAPDFTQCYADVSVTPPAHLPLGGPPTHFALPFPILEKAGQTYHYVFLTSDNVGIHYAATPGAFDPNVIKATLVNDQGQLPQAYANGVWQPLPYATFLGVTLNAAQFGNSVIRIPVAPLELFGGADMLDIVTSVILPDGCKIGFEVYVGGQWIDLAVVTASTNPLAGTPSRLPCNLILTGTPTVAPIIDSSASIARISKSSAALDHVSSPQAPSAPVTRIHKTIVVDNWVQGIQTLTANLRTGTGYATNTPPDGLPIDAVQADGSLLRQWTWTLPAAVPSFEMELTGATTDVTKTFVGRQTAWDASP